MTQNVFAQFLDMSPASLSSIFNDRTRPTLNTVEAIKKKIPDINVDWLLFGSGTMFTSAPPTDDHPSTGGKSVEGSLFDDKRPTPAPSPSMFDFVDVPSGVTPQSTIPNGVRNTRLNPTQDEVKIVDKPQRRVVEIRVFYDDQTWESFSPAKK